VYSVLVVFVSKVVTSVHG